MSVTRSPPPPIALCLCSHLQRIFDKIRTECKLVEEADSPCLDSIITHRRAVIEITKPSFFKRVSDLVASNPPHKWRAFLRTHILYNTSPLLPQVFLDANFELDSVFTGVTPEPRTPNPEPRTPIRRPLSSIRCLLV